MIEEIDRHVDPPQCPLDSRSSEGPEGEVGRWREVHCICIEALIGASLAVEDSIVKDAS